MKHLSILAALVAGPVLAQAPGAAPTAASAKAARAPRSPVVRTQKSLDCSKQADAQNVHGKPRKA